MNCYWTSQMNSKIVVFEDAAHISMHDNPDENNHAIRDFLLELEN